MGEEFELYPRSDKEVLVVYRGERDYSPPYLNLRESETAEVKHKGQPWGGFSEEKHENYDEPQPEIRYKEEPSEPRKESIQQEKYTEPVEETTHEPPKHVTETVETEHSDDEHFSMFLGVLIISLGTILGLLYLAGPYVFITF